jgi:Na+/H+ antiporter NhaD/arsenite permease-like protein
MAAQQWVALGIFILFYGLIISEKVKRTIASIFGAVWIYLIAVLITF